MRPPNYPRGIHTIRADALFASTLQRCDECSAGQIRRVLAQTLTAYGGHGCAGRVAREYGDHPETTAAHMHWVRQLAQKMGAGR